MTIKNTLPRGQRIHNVELDTITHPFLVKPNRLNMMIDLLNEVMEGEWQPARMALLRFPSYEAAKSFYDGEMYSQARAKRAGTTSYFNMVLVEGVDAPI